MTRDEESLRDLQLHTRSLIEAIVDALITTDPAGLITDTNRQAEVVTGRSRAELVGTPFRDRFAEPEAAGQCIRRVVQGDTVRNQVLDAVAADGTRTVLSCNATPFHDRDGVLRGVIVAARDITAQERMDQELRDTNRRLVGANVAAERASLAKSEFLSSMSHELRSPLNAILGFAQLIGTGTPAPTPAQKESVDQILQAGWYLLALINELLDLAQIESGRVSISPEALSLAELLGDCQAMIEPQAQKAAIALSFSGLEQAGFVRADRTRAKQVFVNLLSNAIKYNRVGGRVEVSCSTGARGRTRVSVHDTGEGLPPEKLAQLFQPFNRLGQESGVEQGTGIGLVVSKRLTELMGGAIGAESVVGGGSTFWVELDTAAGDAAAEDTPPAIAEVAADGEDDATVRRDTVLCVEDNPANQRLLAQLLARRPGIRLLQAQDGRRGIEMARASRPDLILMDINLPGISGIAALEVLAADPATAHIPVVAISANAMPRDVEKGLAAGFFRYVTKPIKVDEFMQTLDLALQHARDTAPRAETKETG